MYNQLKNNRLFIWSITLSLILFFFCNLIFVFSWNNLPPDIPLYYSLPWGEEQLAKPISLGLLIVGTTCLSIVNIFLAMILLNKHRFYSQTILVATPTIWLLTAIAIFKIITLIT